VAYYYYVNAFDATYVTWVEIGSSPYLSTQNQPTDYIYYLGVGTGKQEGNWDFADSGAENSETISTVELEVYGKADPDPEFELNPTIYAYVWDGSTWTYFNMSTLFTGVWGWRSISILSKINSWAKVDGCRLYIKYTGFDTLQNCYVDAARLKVTTAAPPSGIKGFKAQIMIRRNEPKLRGFSSRFPSFRPRQVM
jgi:hypothetical protein